MNILVIGKGKTGTTILSKSIQLSVSGAAYHLEPKSIGFFLNRDHSSRENIVKVIYEHWDKTPRLREAIVYNELPLKFDKVVAIIRDLRDEVISRLFYIVVGLVQRGVETRDMDEWLAIIKHKEKHPQSLSFLEMMRELNRIFGTKVTPLAPRDQRYPKFLDRHAAKMYVVKYEDFIEDRLDGLESYLGFELSNERHVGEFHWTKRSGTYNNWKRFFTNSDVEELRDLYEPILSPWGYTDWALDAHATLNPEECSGYVQRLLNNFWTSA
jgi:hypothetical protein